MAEAEITVAGLAVAVEVFQQVDPTTTVELHVTDGDRVTPDTVLLTCSGSGAALLAAERVALNYMQRLSGIASLTHDYLAAVQGTGVRIVDTRKTTPGLRMLEKYAVRMGGGHNHRLGLSDGVLIKENHIELAGGLTEAVALVKQTAGHGHKIEVETSTLTEVNEALAAGAEVIMLDNFSLNDTHTAVQTIAGRAVVEASGGIHLDNVRQVAETGVDVISIGRLTHSAPAAELSMDLFAGTAPPAGASGSDQLPSFR